MRLVHLALTNFRNFASLQTEVPPGPTLLVGANAQGKTSLLEAIYYLVGAWSPHTANDRQLIQLGARPPIARLVAELERAGRTERIEIRLILEPAANGEGRLRKEVLLNGVKKRATDLYGRFNAVLFLPQDVELVEGPPAGRRQQLDAALSQANPHYAAELLEYGRILTQRNALLKQLQERSGTSSQLSFWDEKLSEQGGSMMSRRAAALGELNLLAGPIHAALTAGGESLAIEYQPSFVPRSVNGEEPWQIEALQRGLAAELERLRPDELGRGMTLTGPQRDDLALSVNGLDLRQYGSRGQNRTAMLSLKLAEAEWLVQRTGEHPVLLLDEVLAELDPQRRTDLLERLAAAPQALLTAADVNMFSKDFRENSAVWTIRSGKILESS
ncbi:MAG: DNA replication/repair protein RecF [Anaerolineales bacterium]